MRPPVREPRTATRHLAASV